MHLNENVRELIIIIINKIFSKGLFKMEVGTNY